MNNEHSNWKKTNFLDILLNDLFEITNKKKKLVFFTPFFSWLGFARFFHQGSGVNKKEKKSYNFDEGYHRTIWEEKKLFFFFSCREDCRVININIVEIVIPDDAEVFLPSLWNSAKFNTEGLHTHVQRYFAFTGPYVSHSVGCEKK